MWEQIKDALVHAGVCEQETSTGQIRSAWLKTLKGIESGRLVAGDYQLEIMSNGRKQESDKEQKTEVTQKPRPLPGVRKIGEGSDAERLQRLKEMGIDVSSMEKE